MSPTLLDVAAIVGLPIDGDKVPYLHDVLGTDLDFQGNKKKNTYFTFINTFNKGSDLMGETEHKAFILFWICQFFVCTSLVAVVAEFTLYVSAILS